MTDSFDLDAGPANGVLADETISTSETSSETTETAAVPNGFVQLGLAPELVQAVADLGFVQPTTVQARAIPLAMQGAAIEGEDQGEYAGEHGGAQFNDLMVSSQTGSGKTAAFLLPVLHTLLLQQQQQARDEATSWQKQVDEAAARGEPAPKRAKRKDPTNPRNFKPATPGALVLCPTRELAQQVAHDAIDLVRHCKGLRVANVVGGMPYAMQVAKLQNANLVVATPGRLLDLQRGGQLKLEQVQFLVVDEADRMLDLGFSDDLAEVNQLTIRRHQTMMFSATFAPRIQQLAARVMREPQRVQIDSPQEKHANIRQVMFWADNGQHKRKLLDHWLRDSSINQAIVFASTQIECDALAEELQQEGFSAVALHGALSQGMRNRRLMALRNGQVQILVATDVAARGIDVPTITHVFNFGLPMKAEDYTHRIGRTGRAGRDGIAVTFAEFRDRRRMFEIESYTRQALKAEVIPGLEPQQRAPSVGGGRGRGGNFGGGGGFGGQQRERRGQGFGRDQSFGRKPGFGDSNPDARYGGPRGGHGGQFGGNHDGGAGHGFSKSAYQAKAPYGQRDHGQRDGQPGGYGGPARPGNGGKVFVPRDAKRSFAKPAGGKQMGRAKRP